LSPIIIFADEWIARFVRLGMGKHMFDCGHVEMVKDYLHDLLFMTLNGSKFHRKIDFNAKVEGIKSQLEEKGINLACLVGIIKHCDRKLFETMFKVFCKDIDICNSRTTRIENNQYFEHEILNILINLFFKGVGDGEIITSTLFKILFLIF
jgi:hypothetical protein